ncbi:hypothetical protein NE237_032177 [Protea cynaroides]|uniref:Plastocyanin-like domain-containing protein n=1 Tax=Protea cynaroides TaxID=273540 RepID=A0A9Q0R2U7_9MAGN|nr:hypothetical protein NE237_032177 [Protea cynaroides]
MPREAAELLMCMKKEGISPSLASFNRLLAALVSAGRFDETLRLFSEFVDSEKSRVRLDTFTYNVVIRGLCGEKRMQDANDMFAEMLRRKVVPNRVTFNTLIHGYCKVGDLEEAFRVRDRMKARGVSPNLVTFNSLLSGLCQAQRMEEAKQLLEEMETHGFVPDEYTYANLFNGHSRCGGTESADSLWGLYREMSTNGVQLNDYTCSILLNGLCREGKMTEAEEVLKNLSFTPNTVMYNTVVDGYCRLADMNRALSTVQWMETIGILEEMGEKGFKPDGVSFGTLINCLCKEGNLLEAESLLRDMECRGVSPNVQVYNMLVHGYSKRRKDFRSRRIGSHAERNGNLEESNDLAIDMKAKGLVLNALTYDTLVKGHCQLKDFTGAYLWCKEMFEKGFLLRAYTCNELIIGLRREDTFRLKVKPGKTYLIRLINAALNDDLPLQYCDADAIYLKLSAQTLSSSLLDRPPMSF